MKKICLVLCIILILFFSSVFNMPSYKIENSTQLNEEVKMLYASGQQTNAFNSEKDVLYSSSVCDSKGVEMHNFDIHSPLIEPPQNGFPAVITIHGGAFTNGEKEDFDYITPLLIDNDCIHINMNYRLISDIPSSNGNYYLDMLEDISTLVNFIYKNSNMYNIDVNKIILMGYSSGGNLALVYGLNNYVYEDKNNPENNIPFKGIITEGAPMFSDIDIKNGIAYYNNSSYVQDASIHHKLSSMLCKSTLTYDDLEIVNPLCLSTYKCKNVKLIQGTGIKYNNDDNYDNDNGDALVPITEALSLKFRINDDDCEVITFKNCFHSEYEMFVLRKPEFHDIFVNTLHSVIDGEN